MRLGVSFHRFASRRARLLSHLAGEVAILMSSECVHGPVSHLGLDAGEIEAWSKSVLSFSEK